MPLVLFNLLIGPYQVLSRQARVDLGAMAMKGLLRIPQNPSITGTSPSDCLVSYPGYLLGWVYPASEVQSVYFTATVDCARIEED